MASESLKNLMDQAENCTVVLPDFQRDFVWKPSAVIKLITSIINNYPIGGLLLMENSGIYSYRKLDGVAEMESDGEVRLVLDGQQRLTSCFRAFIDSMIAEKYPGRYFFNYNQWIENPETKGSEIEELILFKPKNEVNKALSTVAMEQSVGLFPLDTIFRTPKGMNYSKWLSQFTYAAAKGDEQEHDRLSELQARFITDFVENVTSYQIHYEEIKKDTSPDVICTVFETINTTGKKLTVFDLLVARCYTCGGPRKLDSPIR